MRIGHVIKFDQTFLNDGNGYNKYTGVFTVPTSGVYLLTYSNENNSKNHLELELVVDSRDMGSLRVYNYRMMASKTIIIRLTAGQSVWLETTWESGADIDSNSSNKFVTFSGVLLY